MNKYPGIEVNEGKRGRSYKVRYRDGRGEQRSRSFKTLGEAKTFKSEVDIARRHGGLPSQRPDKVTFEEIAAKWVAGKHHRSSTARRRDGILDKHLRPAIGHLTIDKIRHSTLQDLINGWTAAGLKPNTVRNHVQVLYSIFDRAVRDDMLLKNPAEGLDLPKVHRMEQRVLTPEECTVLIEAAGTDYGPIIEIFLATGCRWSELMAMNVEDFNPREHTLRVTNSKTDAGNRTIPLESVQAATISKHLLATGRSGIAKGPLFTSPQGQRLNYSNFRARVLIPTLKRAGIEGVTLHSLRRTHATMLISGGHNAKAVQSRMGHASVQTTLSYYAVATEEDKQRTATAMSDYLKRSTGKPNTEEAVV